jgi:protein-ribulosamine 3-kinase
MDDAATSFSSIQVPMIPQELRTSITKILTHNLNENVGAITLQSVGGGSINQTFKITIEKKKSFFLKINSATRYPSLFQKETNGLRLLAASKTILTPEIIACTELQGYQLLLLEWIEPGRKPQNFWENFGYELAKLHQQSAAQYGLDEDNYMGALPQKNTQTNQWVDFFIHQRIEPLLKMAVDSSLMEPVYLPHFSNLYKQIPSIFPSEKPSLLHGDLWSGNFLCNEKNDPVLIDPAVYFGHRQMDLAMTSLFGGFDRIFYESYSHYFPLPADHTQIWQVCNLYPLLIHLNLFGKTYLHDILQTIRRF